MVLGFVQRFEIKYIVELTDNAPDVLGGKTAVFHRIDHISPAGVVVVHGVLAGISPAS